MISKNRGISLLCKEYIRETMNLQIFDKASRMKVYITLAMIEVVIGFLERSLILLYAYKFYKHFYSSHTSLK
ncbi:hypothetical protein [Tepidibacillus sp. HK-1]|uniref:hypothetical protein n=1 Tax=Tepidibacillus sp. HK-1 TaxID=1883407 RepID=UPI000852BEF0|nr:hypothetical protein [Tepidibacillus sp. HK-1]